MRNISKRSKRNPWRNTRNDFKMPWAGILTVIFAALLPLSMIFLAGNLIVRSGAFYTFYVARSEVIKEIPYEVENSDISDAFHDFMLHKNAVFALKENSDYKPQQVFSEQAAQVMGDFRLMMDILLAIGAALFILCAVIGIMMYKKNHGKLLYKRYLNSWIWLGALLVVSSVLIFIPAIRNGIFFKIYGDDFPPGDCLLKIFEMDFWTYFGSAQLIITMALMLGVLYLMKKFVVAHKMFKI